MRALQPLFYALYFIFLFVLHAYFRACTVARAITSMFLVSDSNDLELIRQNLNQLKKVPEHIALFLEHGRNVHELSRVICWCLCAGIRYITLFDSKGFLQNERELQLLQSCFQQARTAFFGSNAAKYRTRFRVVSRPQPNQPDERSSEALVQILSSKEGRNDVIQAARSICEAVKLDKVAVNNITADTITNNLCNAGIPDPDLIVYCDFTDDTTEFHLHSKDKENNFIRDNSHILAGFLPWNIRLTEIMAMQRSREPHYSFSDFMKVLDRFAHKEQRFGT